jgi:hypothetical protein
MGMGAVIPERETMPQKPNMTPQRGSFRDTVFGAFFLVIGGIDIYRGDLYFGAGFIALGLGLMVGSDQAHQLANLDPETKWTPLKIASYALGVVALVFFGLQLWLHFRHP